MSFQIRFTLEAQADLERLYLFLAKNDLAAAEKALDTIDKAWEILEDFPFTCRKVESSNAFLRELVISFGNSGYVALYEIDDERTVTVLAVRHQREDDYY